MTAAVIAAAAVFDDAGLDMAVLHHHRVVQHGHVGHAAMAMALVEIGAEHRILLGGRHRAALLADDVGIAGQDLAEIARGPELVGDDADGNAGPALVAGRPIGDRLAAPETAMGQQVVEVAGLVADQMGEHLALVPARQIRAGRGRRQIELRGITRMLGHGMSSASEAAKQHDRASRRGGRRSIGLRRGQNVRAGCATGLRTELLMTTVPSTMSCSSRRRPLNSPISSTSGDRNEIETQNSTACMAPSTK